MDWIVWLGLAVALAAVAAVTGIKPKGTRPVASSRLMGAARIVLIAVVLILGWMIFRARGG